MTADEQVDYATLEKTVDYLIGQGVHGLVPLGSTGEFYALSPQERQQVLHTTLSAASGRVPVVAGTNAGSTRDVVAYCRQAEQLGAAGVMLASALLLAAEARRTAGTFSGCQRRHRHSHYALQLSGANRSGYEA